jgi:hypothetical protein
MELVIIVVASLMLVAFRQWLSHRRRHMLHLERLASIEKGLPVPPLEPEPVRSGWSVQRLLLLFGFSWISIGVFLFVLLSVLLASPTRPDDMIDGVQWTGLGPILIGLSHLAVFWIGKKHEEPARGAPGFPVEARQPA